MLTRDPCDFRVDRYNERREAAAKAEKAIIATDAPKHRIGTKGL